ncbi:MAG: efflux RND transporter periplasmic adaptor subunit [Rikenellaceae bacterium]
MNNLNKIIIVSLALLVASCGASKKETNNESMSKAEVKERITNVDTIHLRKGVFSKQITCNGKLRAVEKSNLNFLANGEVSQINAINGSWVEKGDLIAVIDTREARNSVSKAEQDLEMSYFSLIDNLIGQGYDSDTINVPDVVLRNSKMSSGYNSSLYTLEEAKRNLDNCYLYAPFSGVIANLDCKKHEQPSGEQFCTIIDNSYFDVEFNLLEAEIFEVQRGQVIKASLFVDDSREYQGVITEINPFVDDEGQVQIRARMKNSDGGLVEGMNMKLIVERDIENLFVVPKDAVVSRDGYFVVFRLIEGKAVWTYIDIAMSNINSHVITGNAKKETTISEDDIIITSGNLNLADGTKVEAR